MTKKPDSYSPTGLFPSEKKLVEADSILENNTPTIPALVTTTLSIENYEEVVFPRYSKSFIAQMKEKILAELGTTVPDDMVKYGDLIDPLLDRLVYPELFRILLNKQCFLFLSFPLMNSYFIVADIGIGYPDNLRVVVETTIANELEKLKDTEILEEDSSGVIVSLTVLARSLLDFVDIDSIYDVDAMWKPPVNEDEKINYIYNLFYKAREGNQIDWVTECIKLGCDT